jgi:hypothetical protein
LPEGFSSSSLTSENQAEFKFLLDDLYFRLSERDWWADQTIKFLLYGNGGGVGLTITLLSLLVKERAPNATWLAVPLVIFLGGIIIVGHLIRSCTRNVRVGRREVRKVMQGYLSHRNYALAFNELGNSIRFPSKSEEFEKLSRYAFACFLIATSLSGFIFVAPEFMKLISHWC